MSENSAVTIHKNIPRPAADIVTQFEVPTGYIADVQGRRGALDCRIKPLFDFPAFAGPAVTVKTVPDDNLAVFAAMGTVQAGDVLIIATDNWTGSAVLGDLVAAMFKNSGIAEGAEIKPLVTRKDDGLDVTCVLVKVPAGIDIPEHIHETQADILYPLQGSAEMYVEGAGNLQLKPGVIVRVPKGAKHKIFNVTQELLIYDVFQPATI